MTDDTLLPFDLPAVCRKKVTVDFDGGNQSSNGGVLLLRESERALGVCRLIANTMTDRRDPDRIRHAMFEMVMARVVAIACGYEDAIDFDRLRHDPLIDHVVVLGERHLRHLLVSYQKYDNEVRTHLSLPKDAPVRRDVCRRGRVLPMSVLGGLHQPYVRV